MRSGEGLTLLAYYSRGVMYGWVMFPMVAHPEEQEELDLSLLVYKVQ